MDQDRTPSPEPPEPSEPRRRTGGHLARHVGKNAVTNPKLRAPQGPDFAEAIAANMRHGGWRPQQ
jgi:hypothetical protein